MAWWCTQPKAPALTMQPFTRSGASCRLGCRYPPIYSSKQVAGPRTVKVLTSQRDELPPPTPTASSSASNKVRLLPTLQRGYLFCAVSMGLSAASQFSCWGACSRCRLVLPASLVLSSLTQRGTCGGGRHSVSSTSCGRSSSAWWRVSRSVVCARTPGKAGGSLHESCILCTGCMAVRILADPRHRNTRFPCRCRGRRALD
jgi:hypothetical protein